MKIQFQDKEFTIPKKLEHFQDLKELIQQKFQDISSKTTIYYNDQDGDKINISCDEDLQAIEDPNSGDNSLIIMVENLENNGYSIENIQFESANGSSI